MTTQAEANTLGGLLAKMRSASGDTQLADAFGQVARNAYWGLAGDAVGTWQELDPKSRKDWVASAQAVLREAEELTRMPK